MTARLTPAELAALEARVLLVVRAHGEEWSMEDEAAAEARGVASLFAEVRAGREMVERLLGVLHALGLSDGMRYCETHERSWLGLLGCETETCPWCRIDALTAPKGDERCLTP